MINFQSSILAYRTIILKATQSSLFEEDILTCPNQYISLKASQYIFSELVSISPFKSQYF